VQLGAWSLGRLRHTRFYFSRAPQMAGQIVDFCLGQSANGKGTSLSDDAE
jgi:hypothetical protein